MNSKEQYGAFYAILSGLSYGFLGYFGLNVVHAAISPTTMLFWRFLIASLFIGLFIRWRKDFSFKPELLLAFGNGALFYGLSTTFYFYACPYLGSGLAMVIFFTYPAMVILLNYFLYGQPIPRIYYLALFIIMIGLFFLIDPNKIKFHLLGIILALASGFLYACYMISSKKIRDLDPKLSALSVCLGCMCSSLCFSLANQSFTTPANLSIWMNLSGIAIVSTAIPILLVLYSLNYISAEKASILSVLEPVFILILGIILLNEPFQFRYLLGALIILSGALLTLNNSPRVLNRSNMILE